MKHRHRAHGSRQTGARSPCRYNGALLNRLVFENLRYRPVRTFLTVLAIGVEVTMILTLVGISYGTLDETARRARGVGADIVVRPPATSVISLSSSPMSQDLVPFFMKQPHITLATGTMIQPLGGFDTLTGIDLAPFNKLSGGFRFVKGGPFQGNNILDTSTTFRYYLTHGSQHEPRTYEPSRSDHLLLEP
jgi:putative ABC transport system permease protein